MRKTTFLSIFLFCFLTSNIFGQEKTGDASVHLRRHNTHMCEDFSKSRWATFAPGYIKEQASMACEKGHNKKVRLMQIEVFGQGKKSVRPPSDICVRIINVLGSDAHEDEDTGATPCQVSNGYIWIWTRDGSSWFRRLMNGMTFGAVNSGPRARIDNIIPNVREELESVVPAMESAEENIRSTRNPLIREELDAEAQEYRSNGITRTGTFRRVPSQKKLLERRK